jgi:hypothetical protein
MSTKLGSTSLHIDLRASEDIFGDAHFQAGRQRRGVSGFHLLEVLGLTRDDSQFASSATMSPCSSVPRLLQPWQP